MLNLKKIILYNEWMNECYSIQFEGGHLEVIVGICNGSELVYFSEMWKQDEKKNLVWLTLKSWTNSRCGKSSHILYLVELHIDV